MSIKITTRQDKPGRNLLRIHGRHSRANRVWSCIHAIDLVLRIRVRHCVVEYTEQALTVDCWCTEVRWNSFSAVAIFRNLVGSRRESCKVEEKEGFLIFICSDRSKRNRTLSPVNIKLTCPKRPTRLIRNTPCEVVRPVCTTPQLPVR